MRTLPLLLFAFVLSLLPRAVLGQPKYGVFFQNLGTQLNLPLLPDDTTISVVVNASYFDGRVSEPHTFQIVADAGIEVEPRLVVLQSGEWTPITVTISGKSHCIMPPLGIQIRDTGANQNNPAEASLAINAQFYDDRREGRMVVPDSMVLRSKAGTSTSNGLTLSVASQDSLYFVNILNLHAPFGLDSEFVKCCCFPFVATARFQPSLAGRYVDTVTLIDQHVSPPDTTHTVLIGIAEEASVPQVHSIPISVIPDPATDRITVRCSEENGPLVMHIVDRLGREVLSSMLDQSTATVDVSSLAPGAYYVRCEGRSSRGSVRFVKR